MKKFLIAIIVLLPFLNYSCGSSSESEPQKEPEKEKVNIVGLWKDKSGNYESVISFASDGTYKMLLYQGGINNFFMSTGDYTYNDNNIICKDNFDDSCNKTYNYSINNDGELSISGSVFPGQRALEGLKYKKEGVESNAFKNNLTGSLFEYGGYTISSNYKTVGECKYYMQFSSDHIAVKKLDTQYYDGSKAGSTKITNLNYIYYGDFLYFRESGMPFSAQFTFEKISSSQARFYYLDSSGSKVLP